MPFNLKKKRGEDLYSVVNKETGKKYSKEPIPEDRAKAQMRALYAAMRREGGSIPKQYVANLSPSERKKQIASINKSKKDYKKGIVEDRPTVSSKPTSRSKYVIDFQNKYGFPITDRSKLKETFPDADTETILSKGVGAYGSSGSRPNVSRSQWAYARLASVLTGGPALRIDKDLVGEKSLKKIMESRETGGGRFRQELHAAVRAQTEAHIARHGRRLTPAESERVEGLVAQAEAALKLLPPGKTYNTDQELQDQLFRLQNEPPHGPVEPGRYDPDAIREEKIASILEKQYNRRVKTIAVQQAAERVGRALAGIRERRREPGFEPTVHVPLIDPERGDPPIDFVYYDDIAHGDELYNLDNAADRYQYLRRTTVDNIMGAQQPGHRHYLVHPLTHRHVQRDELERSRVLARVDDAALPGDIDIRSPRTEQYRPLLQRFANFVLRREPISFPREVFNIARPPPVQAEAFSVLNPMRGLAPAAAAEADDGAAGVGEIGAGMYVGGFIPDRVVYFND